MTKFIPVALLVLLAACGGPKVADVEPYAPDVDAFYTVRLPDDYDPADSYPLVVVLHGCDLNEEQATALRDAGFFFMPDFILLAVRAPFAAGAGYSWVRRPDAGEDVAPALLRQRSARTAEGAVMAAVNDLEEQYQVDPEQRVIVGLGEGAGIAGYLALVHHDVFSGLALCGRPDLELAGTAGMEGAAQLDVFIADQSADGGAAEKLFRTAGARTRAFEVPGPVITAAACRALQNFFDIAAEDAPEDDLGYDEDGEPVPGAKLTPADRGDGPEMVTQEAPDQARGPE